MLFPEAVPPIIAEEGAYTPTGARVGWVERSWDESIGMDEPVTVTGVGYTTPGAVFINAQREVSDVRNLSQHDCKYKGEIIVKTGRWTRKKVFAVQCFIGGNWVEYYVRPNQVRRKTNNQSVQGTNSVVTEKKGQRLADLKPHKEFTVPHLGNTGRGSNPYSA